VAKGSKGMLETYGGVFVAVVLVLFAVEMTVLVAMLRAGFAVGPLVSWLNDTVGLDASGVLGAAGTFGVAYAITRVLKPFQLLLAGVLTPPVAALWGRMRGNVAAQVPSAPSTPPQDPTP